MDNQLIMSRKQFRKMLMPRIGDEIQSNMGNKGRITYVNEGKLRFTADGDAKVGEMIEIDTKIFQVELAGNRRFNASFIGFKKNEVISEPAPEIEENDIVKVID